MRDQNRPLHLQKAHFGTEEKLNYETAKSEHLLI